VHGRSSSGRRPWQAQGDGGAVADLARDVDRAAVLKNNPVREAEAKAGAAVEVPCRIERVKNVR
jgi:hypothetical protein